VVEVMVSAGWAMIVFFQERDDAVSVVGMCAFAAYVEGAVVGMFEVRLTKGASANTP
jgi:hypothetical protein